MGSDLNPVAVLIGKALIEFPPKFAGRPPVNPGPDRVPPARNPPHPYSTTPDPTPDGAAAAISRISTRPRRCRHRFRLADALPPGTMAALDGVAPAQKLDRVSDVLREGHGRRALSDPAIAELVEKALMHFDGERYKLLAWCVMPTHVHVLAEQIRASSIVDRAFLEVVFRSRGQQAARARRRVLGAGIFRSLHARRTAVGGDARLYRDEPGCLGPLRVARGLAVFFGGAGGATAGDPRYKGAEGLADDVRYYGRWMRDEAQKRIGHLYPKAKLKDGREATVIAWLWARTVPSPDPRAEGAPVPLASSFVLSAKEGKEVIVRPVVDRAKRTWRFEIDEAPDAEALKAAKTGTKAARGANFVCLLTGAAIDDQHVKREAKAGRMGAALMAIVAEGSRSRIYLAPTREHAEAAAVERPDAPEIDQPLPNDPRNFWTSSYGLDTFAKLFTPRQLVALKTFSDLVRDARERALADARVSWAGPGADDERPLAEGGLGPAAYADVVGIYLGAVS